MKRYGCWLCMVVLVFIFSSCVTVTPLSNIAENPQKYGGKTVCVNGEVLKVLNIPLVDSSLFLFGDEENRVAVVSSVPHEKGESYRMTGRVVAFPEEGSKDASEEAVMAIADFLVEQELAGKEKAEKIGGTVLKGLYRLSEGLGRVFFLIEGNDPQR